MDLRTFLSISPAKRLLFTCLFALTPIFAAQAASASDYTICIDPGHGGKDPGAMTQSTFGCVIQSLAVNNALEEADVVLDVGKHLRNYLNSAGFGAIYMTRDTDVFLELTERSSYANSKGCTRFVSLHVNSSGTANTATGIETFCYSGNSLSSKACIQAQNIQTEMLKQWPIKDRGRKQDNFHVIRVTSMPATLSEMGFMNNCSPDVNDYLSIASKRQSAALAHFCALETSLGLSQSADCDGSLSNGGSDAGTDGDAGVGSDAGAGSDAGVGSDAGTGNSTATGKVSGVLFEDVGVGTSDMTTRIVGGTVTVNGKSVTTSANGSWSFSDLSVGTQTLTGSASGYNSATKNCTIIEDSTVWCSFGLTKSSSASTKGTLQGVVYQNGNTSDTVAPATVTLNVTGESVIYYGTGNWFFNLEPGTYTVTVSATGYETRTRTCPKAVTTGGTADCDIELIKIVDAGGSTGTGTSTGEGNSSGTDSGNGTGNSNGGSNSSDTSNNEASSDDENSSSTYTVLHGTSCSSAGSDGAAGVLFMAFFLTASLFFFTRRRASVRALPILVLLGVSGVAQADEKAPVQALKTAPFVRADAVRTLVEGTEWTAPVLSPDGSSMAFTRFGMKGLYLRELAGGATEVLSEEQNAGFEPRFSRDGRSIAYRVPGQPFHAMPQQVIDKKGEPVAPFKLHDQVWVYQTKADAIVLREGRAEKVIAVSRTEKFYSPFLTSDAAWVIYNGLGNGVYGYRIADGATVFFGRGSHPSVSEDGRYLAFTATEDDGQEITRGVLHIADLKADSPRVCEVEIMGEIVLHPSISASGSRVAFSNIEGQIKMATLQFE